MNGELLRKIVVMFVGRIKVGGCLARTVVLNVKLELAANRRACEICCSASLEERHGSLAMLLLSTDYHWVGLHEREI